jgi:hypothetical protein
MDFIINLPWPSWGQIFGAAVIFVILYPLRAVMKAMLPEDRLARNFIIQTHVRKKHPFKLQECFIGDCSRLTPSMSEHQSAAASVGSSFIHH